MPVKQTVTFHNECRLDAQLDGRQLSRRKVLGMMSAVGAGMALAPHSFAQNVAAGSRIVDTHHHIFPPAFTARNLKRMTDDSPTFPGSFYSNWTPRYSLEQMDQNGVATAIGSMTSPGVWFGNNEEGRRNARDCNEYGAKLAQDFPGRFGMWGAIPLPDIEGSLREIE